MLKRITNGYMISIPGSRGADVLVITDEGAMWDMSGAAIVKSDVTIAIGELKAAGLKPLSDRVWDWWQRQP